jgi:hypothetical protein
MTPEELAAIRQRCEKATRGPWSLTLGSGNHLYTWVVRRHINGGITFIADCLPDGEGLKLAEKNHVPNMDFIAHARTDIPALLAEIEVYKAVLDDIYEDTFVGCPREVLISQARLKQLPHQRSCTSDTPPA